jgi:sulfonate transport system substrate-binding protein
MSRSSMTTANGTRRRRMSPVVGLPLAGLVALLGTGFVSPVSASASSKPDYAGVTIRAADIDQGDEVALKAAGLFNTPYTVQWSNFPGGTQTFQALDANAADVTAPANSSKPAPSSAQIALLVPQNSPIKTLSELRGKKIGFVPDNFLQTLVYGALTKAGIPYQGGFTPVPLQPAAEVAAFESGSVDAIAVATTSWAQLVLQDHARVLTTGAGITTGLSFVVANASALKNKNEAAAIYNLAQRIQKADVWEGEHPTAWAKVEATQLQIPAALANYTTNYGHIVVWPVSKWTLAEKEQQKEANIFLKLGDLPKAITVSKVFDPANASQ